MVVRNDMETNTAGEDRKSDTLPSIHESLHFLCHIFAGHKHITYAENLEKETKKITMMYSRSYMPFTFYNPGT